MEMKRADIYQGGKLLVSAVPIHLITKHCANGATERYGTLKQLSVLVLLPGTYEVRQDNGRRYDIRITPSTADETATEVPFVVSKELVKE
jgi:hypothetical protein